MSDDRYDSISGRAVAVIFTNDENGYTVLRLEGDDGMFTAVGCIPCAAPGEWYDLSGVWGSHPEHGRQFTVASFERRLPTAPAHIAAFLGSGILHGIGPATAKRIVERFGTETFDILRENPAALSEVRGITDDRALELGELFSFRFELRSLLDFTSQLGLRPEIALRLHARCGSDALSMLTDNPYMLVDESYGVRFSEIDAFALKMGIPPASDMRFEAALKAVLIHNSHSEGHMFLPAGKLTQNAAHMLHLSDSLPLEEALERLTARGEIVREDILRQDACYTSAMYEAESEVAKALVEANTTAARYSRADAEPLISGAEKNLSLSYTPKQREAMFCAAEHGVMILTGGPGTGKTTTIRGILLLFEQMGLSVALAAPTGRSAKRITALTGSPAKTLHRLLEAGFTPDRSRAVFNRNAENPIEADALVIDELSMVDLPLMCAVLEALKPGTRLVLVGDADQLPSIGPGNLLRDLLASGVIPSIHLDEIFRQARQSAIVTGAHAINQGLLPPVPESPDADYFFMRRFDDDKIAGLVIALARSRLPGYRGLTAADIQVISPTKHKQCGTVFLNQALQYALNPPAPDKSELKTAVCTLREGDRVMQTVNNYELPWQRDDGSEASQGVFNGDIGVVESYDERTGLLTVRYDDRLAVYTAQQAAELELVYAVTVHKAQGSEFPCVIYVAGEAADPLLTRNLLYTGFTRAKSLLVVVGRPDIVARMVENNVPQKRYTALRLRLRRAAAGNP